MTKARMIAELQSEARIYGFKLPKDLEKMSKAELEVIYRSSEQAVDDYIAWRNGASVW